MEKRGDANIFWVLVFAILAIVVLTILVVIFGKGVTNVQTDFQGCSVRGGVCQLPPCAPKVEIQGDYCPQKDDQTQVCCLAVAG